MQITATDEYEDAKLVLEYELEYIGEAKESEVKSVACFRVDFALTHDLNAQDVENDAKDGQDAAKQVENVNGDLDDRRTWADVLERAVAVAQPVVVSKETGGVQVVVAEYRVLSAG